MTTKRRLSGIKYILTLLVSVTALTACGGAEPEIQSLEPIPVVEGSIVTEESASNTAQESETVAESPEQTPEPTPSAPPSVSIVMVGDVLLHTPVAKSGLTEDGTYSFDHLFAHVGEQLTAADYKLVNQEVIIGGTELGISGYPAFNAPYELGDALVNAGFNVILHATNHAMDKGKKGVLNCLAFWAEKYPEMIIAGLHGSEEDRDTLRILEKDGIRIALLNYTYGTNGISLPSDMPYCVDLLTEERVKSDLQKAKEAADFVVVCPHWGTEYVLEQTANQRKWAKLFAQSGADLVIATHPHVIEPVCWWICEDGTWKETETLPGEIPDAEEKMLVYYSLGNFVNWTSGTGSGVANRMVGAMAQVEVTADENGAVSITEWNVLPLISHLEQGFGNVTVYPITEYTEELGSRNEIRKQDSAFSYEYCLKLAEKVFGIGRE